MPFSIFSQCLSFLCLQAPLDPIKMLKALSPHLGVSGDVKRMEEIATLVP
jgi:hypothetical protein